MLGKHLASNVFLLHCVFKLALMEILCLDKLQWRANGSLAKHNSKNNAFCYSVCINFVQAYTVHD